MTSILIAEDDPALIKMYKHILELHFRDAEIICASNGKEALEKARDREPSAILSDIDMPILNGIDFHRALKAEFPALARRTGFISASDSATHLDYITNEDLPFLLKPFRVEALFSMVKSILASEQEALHREQGNLCQRVYARRRVREECLLKQVGKESGEVIKGEITDLSEGGFGFRYKEEIFAGDFKVTVSSTPLEIVEREAEMVWTSKTNGDVTAGFRWT